MQKSEFGSKISATLQPRRNRDYDIQKWVAHGSSDKEHSA
jgi:hypothetical protein